MGKLFFFILATFAEFEADLIRLRTRKGIAIARAKVKLHGKQPAAVRRTAAGTLPHATGEYSISDLDELFSQSQDQPPTHTQLGPPYTVSSQRRVVPGKSQ